MNKEPVDGLYSVGFLPKLDPSVDIIDSGLRHSKTAFSKFRQQWAGGNAEVPGDTSVRAMPKRGTRQFPDHSALRR